MAGVKTRSSTDLTMENKVDNSAPAWALKIQKEIAALNEKIDKLPISMDEKLAAHLEPIKKENIDLRKTVSNLENEVEAQKHTINSLNEKYKISNKRLIAMESYSMRENLTFVGLGELIGETEKDLQQSLVSLINNDMSLNNHDITILKCHRLPRRGINAGPRDVLVKFGSLTGRNAVLAAASKLRTRRVFINEQFPQEIEHQRRVLWPAYKLAKEQKMKTVLKADKLIINSKIYTTETLHDIPLDTHKLGTRTTPNYVLYGGRYSVFSSFYTKPDLFSDKERAYCSAEQYYQHARAMFMNRPDVAREILNEIDPAVIKKLGNNLQVKNDSWLVSAPDVMRQAVFLKFQQNPDLLNAITQCGDRQFVECNKYDKFWGSGIGLNDPNADNPAEWKGSNNMGAILNAVRQELINNRRVSEP